CVLRWNATTAVALAAATHARLKSAFTDGTQRRNESKGRNQRRNTRVAISPAIARRFSTLSGCVPCLPCGVAFHLGMRLFAKPIGEADRGRRGGSCVRSFVS